MNNFVKGVDFLTISTISKIYLICFKDIIYCVSDGKYTSFYLTSGKVLLSSINIGEYEKVLKNSCFFRIHNSFIVNISHLIFINKKDGYYCELSNNLRIPVSKRKLNVFLDFLKR